MKPFTLIMFILGIVALMLDYQSPQFWRTVAVMLYIVSGMVAWEFIAIQRDRKR